MRLAIISFFVLLWVGIFAGLYWYYGLRSAGPGTVQDPTVRTKPLEKYSIEALRTRKPQTGAIVIGAEQERTEEYISRIFTFESEGKKVSGQINLPAQEGTYPLIVMMRGFAPAETYFTGEGSQRAGQYLAARGYITVSPDFLGFGESDEPSGDAMESRFQTYTTVLDLIASLPAISSEIQTQFPGGPRADLKKTGMWAHSNGGHIALTVLEVTGASYPTVLWAPVTKPFPYSVFYYMDEAGDGGKMLRKIVAEFETNYNADRFSLTEYTDLIKAPIQLHQGTADEAVPLRWSDEFNFQMTEKEKDFEYVVHDGEDHNFSKGGWDEVMKQTEEFFKKRFAN